MRGEYKKKDAKTKETATAKSSLGFCDIYHWHNNQVSAREKSEGARATYFIKEFNRNHGLNLMAIMYSSYLSLKLLSLDASNVCVYLRMIGTIYNHQIRTYGWDSHGFFHRKKRSACTSASSILSYVSHFAQYWLLFYLAILEANHKGSTSTTKWTD